MTSTADMPASEHTPLSYSGEALATLIQADSGYEMSGQSSVDVDFGAGTVDIRTDEFIATDLTSSEIVANPVSVINIDGAAISGNQISGGAFSASLGGESVDLTGANSTSNMLGNFFGYDASNTAPDEVGVVFLQQGDDGILAGGFIAD